MTSMIGDPTVSSTTPVCNPPPVTRAPQGQTVTPSLQGQQMTSAGSSGSGGDMLCHVSVRSDQVAIGNNCMPTLSTAQ